MVSHRRRRLIKATVGGAVGASFRPSHRPKAGTTSAASGEASPPVLDAFDPRVHGFGFANWEGETGTGADGETFTYESGTVTRDEVRRTIDESWSTTLSEAQTALLTRIVYAWIAGETATNGHCYGMALAADHYFRIPSDLPDGVDVASDVPHPTGRYDAVGERIRWFQTSQLLRAEPYWFAFLGLRWGLGDHSESLDRLTEAIDATGTSGIALTGAPIAHQVLAYGYERGDDRTDVFVYDPTFQASAHGDPDDVWTLSVDPGTGEVHEIKGGYDEFVYHDPGMSLSVADQLIGGRDRVRNALANAVFLGLKTGETLEIEVPDDVLVDRPAAEYADADGSAYADAAVVFGPPEEFEISIDGEDGAAFSLDVLGTRDGDLAIEDVVSDTLGDVPTRLRFAVDETGEFVVDVLEEGAEEAAEEADDAADEAGDAAAEAEEAAEKAGEAADELGETAGAGSEDDSGEPSEGAEGVADNWWIAVAGGAVGLGATYRLLARRFGEED